MPAFCVLRLHMNMCVCIIGPTNLKCALDQHRNCNRLHPFVLRDLPVSQAPGLGSWQCPEFPQPTTPDPPFPHYESKSNPYAQDRSGHKRPIHAPTVKHNRAVPRCAANADILDTWIHRYAENADTGVCGYTGTQIRPYADTQTHRHSATQTRRYAGTQTRRTIDMDRSESMREARARSGHLKLPAGGRRRCGPSCLTMSVHARCGNRFRPQLTVHGHGCTNLGARETVYGWQRDVH